MVNYIHGKTTLDLLRKKPGENLYCLGCQCNRKFVTQTEQKAFIPTFYPNTQTPCYLIELVCSECGAIEKFYSPTNDPNQSPQNFHQHESRVPPTWLMEIQVATS